jgi:hypothetical protein
MFIEPHQLTSRPPQEGHVYARVSISQTHMALLAEGGLGSGLSINIALLAEGRVRLIVGL